MKRVFTGLLALLLILSLSACGEDPQPTVTTTSGPTAGTTVDLLLETSFQDAKKALDTYLQTGKLPDEEGNDQVAGYSKGEVYRILYDWFLSVSDHPEAEVYLDHFYLLPDKALSMEVVRYIAGEETSRQKGSFDYRPSGEILEEPVLSASGDLVSLQYGYGYNRLSSIWEFKYLDDGTKYISGHTTYNYDKFGALIQTEYTPAGNGTAVRGYYQDGLLVREERRSGALSKELDVDLTYTYEEGRLVSIQSTDGSLTEYTYNDAGQCIRRVENGAVWELSYDEAGNLLREYYEETDNATLLQSKLVEYTYENGHLLTETRTDTYSYSAGTWTEQTVITYTYGEYCIYS